MSDHRTKTEIMRLRQELREAEELLAEFYEKYRMHRHFEGDQEVAMFRRAYEFLNRNKGE